MAELARAFGMTVAAYDPFVKPDAMAKHGVRPAAENLDFGERHAHFAPIGTIAPERRARVRGGGGRSGLDDDFHSGSLA